MTTEEFERIKKLIAKEQENAMKAEGALERIKQQLEKDFGIKSDEEAQEEIERLKRELEHIEKEKDELTEKLEGITDWSML